MTVDAFIQLLGGFKTTSKWTWEVEAKCRSIGHPTNAENRGHGYYGCRCPLYNGKNKVKDPTPSRDDQTQVVQIGRGSPYDRGRVGKPFGNRQRCIRVTTG